MTFRDLSIVLLFVLVPQLAAAQSTASTPIINPVEHLSFNRPEAWALKYFDSATLLSGLETPRTLTPGSISIGVELGWLPSLSVVQRRVGFNGTKEEDLNKAPLFPRVRVTVGLPQKWSAIVAADPPVRAFGIKPKLVAVGLGRPLLETDAWTVGIRGYGQIGSVQAAFTCPQDVVAFTPGSAENSYGCQAESSDTATLRFAGGEVSAAYRPGGRPHALSPHVAVGINFFDVAFQVNALTFGYIDHTQLSSRGATASASGGLSCPLGDRFQAAVDVFYTPLSVRRAIAGPVQNDGLFNVRALFTYRLR
jgi:hypothetical protein